MSSSSSAAGSVQLAYPSDYFASGYATSASNQSSELDDSYTDKVGGAPTYTNTVPMPAAPTCEYCQSSLFLLTQFYIPATATHPNPASNSALTTPSFERVLYVFGCNKYECAEKGDMKSWKVLRIAFGDENDRIRFNSAPAAVTSSAAVDTQPAAAAVASPTATKSTKAASSASATKAKATISDDDDDEWGAKAAWSDDDNETPAKPTQSSSSASSSAVKDIKKASKKADSDDEWGAKGEWSDDDNDKSKNKKKAKDDDDAVLSALLAKQSLNKAANDAKKLAAEEKAAAKAARKAQAAEEKRIAQEELIKAALEARENAEANNANAAAVATPNSNSTPSSSSSSEITSVNSTCFRPFYLVWTPEPAAAPLELARELRLLKEYEQRRLEEGEKGIFDEESEANSTNTAATGEGEGDDEDDMPEQREDEVQSFFDRLDRMREQCIRYYGVEVQRKLEMFNAPTIPDAAMFMDKKQQTWAEQQMVKEKRNATLVCQTCQKPMVMEAQLMPNLLREIHADSINPKDPGMDWTTVDIYSCPNSCNLNKYVEEAIHVQPPL